MHAKTEVGNMGLKLQEAKEHTFSPHFVYLLPCFLVNAITPETRFFFLSALHFTVIKSVQLSTAPQNLNPC